MKSRGSSKAWQRCMLVLLVCLVVLGVLAFREISLETTQNEALAELDGKIGQYDGQTIVLQDTNRVRAENLAERLGARLRITSDGRYATLTLPEGTTIRDVYAADENRELIPELSADYRASVSDLLAEDTDQGDGIRLPQGPDYPVADPGFEQQGYLDYLNLDRIWNANTGSGVLVAVIDTGIDTDHPEFAGRISQYSYNASDDKVVMDYGMEIIEDEQGHGTAVAGVIGAAMDGNGTVGVAPGVELLVIKAECDESGNFYRSSDLVFGLYYAVERGANVVNMSFGTYSMTDPFADAARLAYDSDIICVAAAGNDATTALSFPAAGEYVFGVGALADGSWELAEYSNYGDNVNIVAPGTTYTTAMGGYGVKVGTSLASPAVAGVLALYMYENPYITVDQVEEVLYASSTDLGSLGEDWLYGYGAVDAGALLLEEKGTIVFNMQSDELEDIEQIFVRNHTLQNIPEPERLYAVFDGWYYDAQCTEPYEWYADTFTADLTLYAKWANEDDAVPYTYVTLDDGTVEIRSYTGHRKYITIPDEIDGKTVSSIGMGAFENQDRLQEVNLPRKLRIIGDNAFQGCTQLMQIRIPASVETIGNAAFADNARLSVVIFDQGSRLEKIGDYAFSGCAISRLELPASLQEMNGTALMGTTGLTAIGIQAGNSHFAVSDGVLFNKTGSTLVAFPAGRTGAYRVPASVRTIGIGAFSYTQAQVDLNAVQTLENMAFAYSRLTGIVIPDSVTDMGVQTFMYSGSLSQVELGTGLNTVGQEAFVGCGMLQTVTIPDNITSIGAVAFQRCTGLERVTFGQNSGLTEIGAGAFNTTGLLEIDIPASVVNVGEEAFANDMALASVTFAEGSVLQGIGKKAFENTVSLTEITLPESLRYLQNYAFRYSGLTAVTVPANVELLGAGVFAACHDLPVIEVAAGNAHYVSVDGAVYDTAMETLVAYPAGSTAATLNVPGTVKTVAEAAVYGSYNLNNVTIPGSVTVVEEYGFYDCRNVTGYTLNEGLEEIQSYAFADNTSLTSLSIPDSVMLISRYAFAGDMSMYTVQISENTALTRLGYGAFAYTGLNFFRVPANIATMAQGVFEGCTQLHSVTFAENSRLDILSAYTFDGCENLTSITFEPGSKLTTIAAHGLEGMRNLYTIDFGDAKITEIGNYAFRFCEKLTTVAIPDTLVDIGRFAFYGCEGLDTLTLPVGLEHIGSYAFYGAEDLKLYFTSDFLPLYLDESWDEGIFAYHVGVSEVLTQGDWEYAVLNSGKISIVSYNGTATSVSLNQLDLGGEIAGIGGHAFYGSPVSLVILPDSLTSIQAYAFAESDVMSITIPAGVDFIGRSTFENTPLTVLTFAEDSQIRVIEQNAFAGTGYLTSVKLPASLESLGRKAFFESGIRSVEFEAGIALTEIPVQCFAGTKLTDVVIPDTVKLIDDSAFRDCLHLTQMTLGAGEDLYLGSNVFYNTGLTAVDIPANVGYIGEFAFVGLENLKNFTVSAENPWYQAVDGLLMSKDGRKLVAVPAGRTGSLTVPSSVETIGFGAFENSKLSAVEFDPNSNILTLGYRAFFGAEHLKSITVPASVVSIDYYAFAGCTALESVTFAQGNRLTGIYEGAFYGCEKLSDITLPDTILEVSDFAFYGCESLTTLPVSETSGLRSISDYAFAYTGMEELVIPDNVIDIGEYAFMGLKVKSITVPDASKRELIIGLGAFAECYELEEITVPFIGSSYDDDRHYWFSYIFGAGNYFASATYMPESVKTVTITEGLTAIPDFAFAYLENLEKINVPHSVVSLGYNAFGGTKATYELTNTISFATWGGSYDANSLGMGITGKLTMADGPETLPVTFYGTDIEEVVLPSTVKSFGYCDFQMCEKLVRVQLPEGLESIPAWLFNGCVSLQEVSIPAGVQQIGAGAFDGCGNLRKITLPEGLTEIGRSAFNRCSSLEQLVIPDSVTTIGEYAFGNCENIRELTLGANVTTIGEYAFANNSAMNVVYNNSGLVLIPGSEECGYVAMYAKIIHNADGSKTYLDPNAEFAIVDTADGLRFNYEYGQYTLVDYLGNEETVVLPLTVNGQSYTIRSLTGIRHVIIPEGFTEIPEMAFWSNQTSILESIVIPDTVTRIGNNALAACENLRSVVIPDSVTELGWGVFSDCTALEQVVLSKNIVELTGATFNGCTSLKEVYIPEGVGGVGVAFTNCTALTYVNIPASVQYINSGAFAGCVKLAGLDIAPGNDNFREKDGILYNKEMTEILLVPINLSGAIVLPDTLQYIPQGAFQGRNLITSVTIPEGIVEIWSEAFADCKSLKSVSLPGSLRTIYEYVFRGCTALEQIEIPEAVVEIGGHAFEGCTSLKEISLPDSMTRLGQYAFAGCTSLVSVDMPDALEFMDCNVFENCDALTTVKWPASLNTIPMRTFSGCDGLTSFEIPAGVTTIEDSAFSYCTSLEQVTIPDSVTRINDYAFTGCRSLKDLVIPEKVEYIGYFAFSNCGALTELVIPDSVTEIGEEAFNYCTGLRTVTIGNGVTEIPSNTFIRCESMLELTLGKNVTTIQTNAFLECSKLRVIHNNSALDIQPGSEDHGGIGLNANAVIGPDGSATYAEGCEGYEITETAEGLLFAVEDGSYVLLGYTGDQEHVTLPSSYQGQSYKIAAFSGFTHVVVPEGVTEILAEAGEFNGQLRSMEIGENVRVGSYAFYDCRNLQRVVVGPGVYLEDFALMGTERLTDVTLDPNIAGLSHAVFEWSAILEQEELWVNGCLFIDGHLIKVSQEAKFLDWDFTGKNDTAAFQEAYSLKQSYVGGDTEYILSGISNLETVIMLENDMWSLESYFGWYPSTLKNVVIPEGVEIHTSNLLYGLENVSVFVGSDATDVLHWDNTYPGWNNGNKVYYGDQWNTVCFYDTNGDLLSREFVLTHQVIRVPHYEGSADDQYVYELVGWDINGDGNADRIPATTEVDIHAYPVVEATARKYTVTFYDKDGQTVLYTQQVPYGGRIQNPADPTKTGYAFNGWAGFDENTVVTGDMEVYSSWSHLGDSHVYGRGVRVAPTCTEPGGVRYTCTVCDESYLDGYEAPTGHSYTTTTVAGCEDMGYDLHTCDCGHSYRDSYTEAQGHVFGGWTVTKEPTCSASGSRYHNCDRCGIQETEQIPAIPHDCDAVMTAMPSCTAEGTMTYTCRVCGHTTEEVLPMTTHRYEKQQQALELVELLAQNLEDMFWTQEGDMGVWFVCADCGHIQTSEEAGSIQSSAAGADCTHTTAVWEVAVEATEETPGVMWRVCQLCGKAIEARSIGIVCSSHHYVPAVTDPTCLTQGYTTYSCPTCGDSYRDEYVSALGHEFGAWYEDEAPDCTESGTERRDCGRCDRYETRTIPETGHNYVPKVTDPTCEDQGYTTHSCSACGDSYVDTYVVELGHSYGQWYVYAEATLSAPGEERRDCDRCDHYESREIPQKENPFSDVPQGQYYYGPVLWAVENGITTGTGDGTVFSPDRACTRAQVVTFLWRAAGCPEPQNMTHNFTDVKVGSYYEKAVIWAVEQGITSGKGSATTFQPETTCTRAEVVTFLWRAKGQPAPESTNNPFPDVPAGSYYEKAVLWAVENNITTGKGNGNFAPTESCTRAHVVTFLYRAFAE